MTLIVDKNIETCSATEWYHVGR